MYVFYILFVFQVFAEYISSTDLSDGLKRGILIEVNQYLIYSQGIGNICFVKCHIFYSFWTEGLISAVDYMMFVNSIAYVMR